MPQFPITLKRSPVALFVGNQRVASMTLKPRAAVSAVQAASQTLLQPAESAHPGKMPGITPKMAEDLMDLLTQIAEDMRELQEQHRRSLEEMQHAAVALAVSSASWLTGTAIDRDQFAVDDLIRNAIHQLQVDEPVRVTLNPDDHRLLKQLLGEMPDQDLTEHVTCAEDQALSRGSLRVDSGRRALVTDIETRLEAIRKTWMENLDAAQVERRADGTGSRTLRRFPERRETA